MTDRLTKKERGFVVDYLKTGNGTQAALANYDTESENTAAAIASENLRKPKILNLIEEKLPDEELFQIHREGLYATKPNWEQNDDKQWENVGDEPDYVSRHKYLDTAYKLKGSYAPEKRLNVNVEIETDPIVQDLTNKLNDIYRSTSVAGDGGATSPLGTETQDKE